MSPLLNIVALLITMALALSAQGSPLSTSQTEAFLLHHHAALRGLAAVKKANDLKAAAAAAAAAAKPSSAAAPAKLTAMPSKDIWRQFVLDLLSAKIERHQASQTASLPEVTLTQKTLTRLLAEGRQQTSSAWHRAAALQLRAVMEADRRLVLAQRRPGGKGPTSAMAEAVTELKATKRQPVPADTEVPPLSKDEMSYIRELLEEAVEGDVILPQ